jgi:hypothetical protein
MRDARSMQVCCAVLVRVCGVEGACKRTCAARCHATSHRCVRACLCVQPTNYEQTCNWSLPASSHLQADSSRRSSFTESPAGAITGVM